jgi:membrane protein required for colicin V production
MQNLPQFTAFDIVALVIVVISALISLSRGAVREVVIIAAWVGAAAVTWFAWAPGLALVETYIANDLIAVVVAALIVFVVPLVLFKVVGQMMVARIDGSAFGPIDRLLGVVFGVARGAFIICLFYFLADFVIDRSDHPRWVSAAWSRPHVEEGVELIRRFVPEEVAEQGRETAEEAVRRGEALGAAADALRRPRVRSDTDGGYDENAADALDQLIEKRQ